MAEIASSFDQSLCPLCGKTNQCAMEIEKAIGVKQAACWCVGMDFSADLLARVPATAKGQACICATCALQSQGNKVQTLDT